MYGGMGNKSPSSNATSPSKRRDPHVPPLAHASEDEELPSERKRLPSVRSYEEALRKESMEIVENEIEKKREVNVNVMNNYGNSHPTRSDPEIQAAKNTVLNSITFE